MGVTAIAGTNAELPPLISPGKLLQQYFIDWQDANSSQTIARIEGPRSTIPLFEPNERYSVNPDSFVLMIDSVRFEDRGSYLGVIGVMDPAGMSFTYDQTRVRTVTLEVYGEQFLNDDTNVPHC